ncbi:MAG: FecR domain-containing protein, partial [Planctomycetota bacterium]
MKCSKALDLLQPLVDGELDVDSQRAVLAHLRACDSCRLAYQQLRELARAAAQALRQQEAAPAELAQAVGRRIGKDPRTTEAARRAGWRPADSVRRTGLVVAGATALVLVATALLNAFYPGLVRLPSWLAALRGGDTALVAVVTVRQPVTDGTGHALEIGDRLDAGDTVRTGDGGRVTLVTRRGSEYTLNVNTELHLDRGGTSAELRTGEVYCRSRDREIQKIETAAGRIHLLGTALDAATHDRDAVAVTVVEGQVRLTNAYGEAVIQAGHKALLVASLPPEGGVATNTFDDIAWYSGRRDILSDFGDIVYTVNRQEAEYLVSEVWAMNADGTGKRHVKSYLAYLPKAGPWFPQDQWLLIQAGPLLYQRPDLERRRAHAGGGHPVTSAPQVWFLNAATGQEVPLQIPPEYRLSQVSVSPDGTKAVFTATCWQDFPYGPFEGGAWLYDVQTGEITKLTDSIVNGLDSWSPDSRFLAVSLRDRRTYYGPLALMDTTDGRIEELQPEGFGSSFSPDGRKLTYYGDQERGPRVTRTYRLFVLDLADPESAVPVTPPCPEIRSPTWSPDGTRIAYWEDRSTHTDPDDGIVFPAYALYVAEADGSGVTKLYEAPERISAV